ncbi:hypothetical protein EDC04DRAFT_2886680 [Pisolithus marmoratus]|nr:hypothetical protein EDC04DRAFT_2886680 [Pisolithus marmoratus]
MEPELAEDGCNWHTYGSWVLKAISEEGLMGHLDGSETRPATPKLLQEYGASQTPRTNEERDVIAAWKTADDAWHQRAAMAHQYIIFGLPDSILMLCMHLDTPGEAFAYLESRYGSIPRPESLKIVDEASRQCNLPSKQCATAESTQNIFDSHHEPENPPSSEEGSPDSPNDCVETESKYLTPEADVIDMQQVEDTLLAEEAWTEDSEQLDECPDTLEAPDEGCQHASGKIEESRDLLELSSKALEPEGDTTRLASRHSMKDVPQTPFEVNQHLWTSSKIALDVPDPPDARSEHPILRIHAPTQVHSASSTKSFLPVLETASMEPDEVGSGDRHDDAPSSGYINSYGVKNALLADSGGQHGERKAKRLRCSPAPPVLHPKGTGHAPRTSRVPRRRGRIKQTIESISDAQKRQSAYLAEAAPMRPLLDLFAPSKWTIYHAGGLQTMSIRYNKVRSAGQIETSGWTHRTAGISMRLLQLLPNPSKQFWNIANTHWRQGVHTGSTLNDAKRPKNLHIAKRPPPSSNMRRENEHKAKWPNGLSAPSKPTRYGLSHPPGTLRDPRRRGRIKTRAKNVSRSKTRGSKASKLTTPIPPPRKLARLLWNVANTYWRQGVPPGRTQNDNKPVIFKTAALAITVQGQGARALQPSPKREVATMRRGKHD